MIYPYVVSCAWNWRQTAKNMREMAVEDDSEMKVHMLAAAKIYDDCAADLIMAFQKETMEVQNLLSTTPTLDEFAQLVKTQTGKG